MAVKLISLISGGMDSAVATALALEQGKEVVGVHFSTVPFADGKSEEKTKKVLQHLAEKFDCVIKYYSIPFGKFALKEIAKNCERKYNCVLCRRMMLRIGEVIALKENGGALLTGESLGQVASQTLPNLATILTAIKIPVVKPLLGMDKLEIETLARNYGTLGISSLPSMCCNIPDKPSTKANIEKIEELEEKLNIVKIIDDSLQESKVEEFEKKWN